MPTSEVVGSVSGLWRFPVKSMGGEQLQAVEVTEKGVLGDRAYALMDNDTGKVVSAKSVRLFPDLFEFSAAFVVEPCLDEGMPEVEITFPDGTSLRSDSGEVDRVLSAHFNQNVRLERVAISDEESGDTGGDQDKLVAQRPGSPPPVGSFLDAYPMSVLTTSTLKRLNELEPGSRFDERRFRMNVIVDTERLGFIENDWVGHDLAFGETTRLGVTLPDPRCVMTTLAQGDLPKDADVLRAIVRHNNLQVRDLGQLPCVGVYAVVGMRGPVRIGDPVTIG
ncbi:MAG: MOSC N-terminal beta barrel domain-containing protein [Dehalococcoidia bacterium]